MRGHKRIRIPSKNPKSAFSGNASKYISIAKKTYLLLILTFLSTLLNLGISWMLIPSWGLIGACLGSAISGIFYFVAKSYYAQKYYKSIGHAVRTVFTVLSVIVLAAGNLLLNNSFWGIVALTMTVLLFAGLVYYREIFQIMSFSKDIISRTIKT